MKKYEEEEYKGYGSHWINVLVTNAKQEKMIIELTECTNPGGASSLPNLWYKEGWTPKVLDTWLSVQTYIEDSEGGCRGDYNPTAKRSDDGKRSVINFDWMFENTEENKQKLIDECIRRFEAAKGKSATELKMERINSFAKEKGLKIVYEVPEGWKYWPSASAPIGTVFISNGKKLLRNENGKLQKNPDYKEMLLVI